LFVPLWGELTDPRLAAALAADEHGWDGSFVRDHTTYRPPVRTIAMTTKRLRPMPRQRLGKVGSMLLGQGAPAASARCAAQETMHFSGYRR